MLERVIKRYRDASSPGLDAVARYASLSAAFVDYWLTADLGYLKRNPRCRAAS